MKIKFGTSRFALGVLAITGALAFASSASAKNPKEVKMKIDENNNLVVTTPKGENGCKWPQRRGPGCIKVDKDESSELEFHLTSNPNCKLDSGTKWELTAAYLGGYNSTSKPGEDDFGFDTITDADYNKVKSDFNIVDRTSGRVTLLNTSSAKKLIINNENKHKYVVWYKIEATCERTDGGSAHIRTTDPRVRNGGTN